MAVFDAEKLNPAEVPVLLSWEFAGDQVYRLYVRVPPLAVAIRLSPVSE